MNFGLRLRIQWIVFRYVLFCFVLISHYKFHFMPFEPVVFLFLCHLDLCVVSWITAVFFVWKEKIVKNCRLTAIFFLCEFILLQKELATRKQTKQMFDKKKTSKKKLYWNSVESQLLWIQPRWEVYEYTSVWKGCGNFHILIFFSIWHARIE